MDKSNQSRFTASQQIAGIVSGIGLGCLVVTAAQSDIPMFMFFLVLTGILVALTLREGE